MQGTNPIENVLWLKIWAQGLEQMLNSFKSICQLAVMPLKNTFLLNRPPASAALATGGGAGLARVQDELAAAGGRRDQLQRRGRRRSLGRRIPRLSWQVTHIRQLSMKKYRMAQQDKLRRLFHYHGKSC